MNSNQCLMKIYYSVLEKYSGGQRPPEYLVFIVSELVS